MRPKKNSKIILILIISIIVLILLTGLAFAYFATDMFKSNKDLFFKYITQIGEEKDGFIDPQLKQYFEKQKTTPYQNQGTITPNITTNSNQTREYEAVNNFNITFFGQTDKLTNNFMQDISLNYSSDVTFPINIRKVGNNIGLQTQYIGSKYIAIETNSQNNEALKSLNEVIEQTQKVKSLNNISFSNEELKQIQETYLSAINNELQESQFSKENNGYKLTINGEQLKNVIAKLLETLKNDQKTLDKINEYLNEQKSSLKLTASNIDNYKKTMEQDTDGNNETYEITVFGQKGKMNKLTISSEELLITIEKEKINDTLKYKMSIESKEDGNSGLSFSMNYTGLNGLQSVNEEYIIEIAVDPSQEVIDSEQMTPNTTNNVITKYQINNQIDFIENAEIEELSEDNAMILNNYEEEQVANFLQQVGERIQKVNKQQMEQLGLEEYQNPLIQMLAPGLGLFIYNQATDVVNNTNMSEAEINAFNSKFENYESTNLRGVTVKGLISTIQTSNASQNGNKKIKEIHFNGEEYEVTDQNISFLKDSVELETAYRVEFERNEETGIIYRAVINKK